MSGRHLRRGRAAGARRLLALLGLLLVGAAAGAGGWLLWAERSSPSSTEAAGGSAGSAALAPEPGPITIALAGDITASAALLDRLAQDRDDVVGSVAEVLRDADLAVVDLDAPVAAEPSAAPEVAAVPPATLAALHAAGVDVVSAANDRSLDLGADAALAAASDAGRGVSVIGVGADEASAYRPFVREVGGQTVAVIAATQLLDPARIGSDTAGPGQAGVASAKRVDRLVAEVEAARATADTVVVYLHWGTPGETCPSTSQRELAAALVAAGADVVAGPGAGRVQGAGRAGGAAVAYGLGTLLAEQPEDVDSGVLLVRIDGREVIDIAWVPTTLGADGFPSLRLGAEATDATARWDELRGCAELGPG
jgi:poly-gamma-glutamate synthesis protein (capsule biosynthesis protein)